MLAHSLQFSFLLAFGTNFIQHLIFLAIERKGTALRRFGPLCVALVGLALLMMQPSLFVFQDVGCPVRCVLKDHATLLHVCFILGGVLLFTAAAWSMGLLARFAPSSR
jgi:hypothetical protein